MLNVNVADGPATLRAAVLAMKRADAEVRRDVAGRMRETMNPVWRQEVTERAGGGMAGRILTAGVRIASGNPAQLIAANSSRKIGRGLVPSRHWAGYEYGAGEGIRTVTSSKGNRYRRHVMRHLPARTADGHAIEPAVRAVLPRIASFWVQSVERAFLDAADGKG